MIIDPRPMTLGSWVNAVTFSLRDYGLIPPLEGGDWKTWARSVIQLPRIAAKSPPNPKSYSLEDWKTWAIYFNLAVGY